MLASPSSTAGKSHGQVFRERQWFRVTSTADIWRVGLKGLNLQHLCRLLFELPDLPVTSDGQHSPQSKEPDAQDGKDRSSYIPPVESAAEAAVPFALVQRLPLSAHRGRIGSRELVEVEVQSGDIGPRDEHVQRAFNQQPRRAVPRDPQDAQEDKEAAEGHEGSAVGHRRSDRGQLQLVELDVQLLCFLPIGALETTVSASELVVVNAPQAGDARVAPCGTVRHRAAGQDQQVQEHLQHLAAGCKRRVCYHFESCYFVLGDVRLDAPLPRGSSRRRSGLWVPPREA